MKKLLMFAASGLLAPMAVTTTAHAEVGSSTQTLMIPSPVNDKAPVSGTPARLRRTDEEQPGNEMPTMALFANGIDGLYFSMNTELPPTTPGGAVRPATHRMQLAAVPFSLTQMVDGKVTVAPKIAESKFVTNNIGNEYRNANAPVALPVLDGKLIMAKYNYQANGSNDTKTYIQLFNAQGTAVLGQTLFFAKNNDDCGMHQDGAFASVVPTGATSFRTVSYLGCNGNGADDGWVAIHDVTCDAGLTSCTLNKVADVSVCPREERSRGNCTIGTDPNTAICTWTEGNTQPQRDGTWMAAINIGAGQNGAQAQSRILWKKQIEGRKDIEGIRTYSMRAMQSRITTVDAAGKLANTDQMIWRSGDLRGNNNNNGKGGTYYRSQMGVIEATAAGMKYIAPLTDVSLTLLGLDGTHLGMTGGSFGTTNALTPGIVFLGGSHTGGGTNSQARVVTYDAATKTFADAAMMGLAPHDRHLYPNYTGNNPGNQGRNHSAMITVANPFVGKVAAGGTVANTDAYLMLASTSGKEPGLMMAPERKLSAYLSVLPIAQTPKAATGGTGSGSGSGSGSGTPGTDPVDEGGGDEAGTALGGCSTSGSTGGLMTFLLIGLAAFGIRRRR